MATQQSIPQLVEQQKSAVVFPIPKLVPKQITQAELEEIILLRRKQETLDALEADLKQRLEVGALVEDGIHVAKLKHGSRRNVAWREVAQRLGDRLFGNGKGEPYCDKVLNSTKPTPTVSLVVQ
jgi:hypothetical protein